MATKTISLELDAYEKLRRAKRGGESFSAVVRRARFEEADGSVEEPLARYGKSPDTPSSEADYWDRIDAAKRIEVALESFDAANERQVGRNRDWKTRIGSSQLPKDRGWTREDLYRESDQ